MYTAGQRVRVVSGPETRYFLSNRTAPFYFENANTYPWWRRGLGVSRHQRKHGWAILTTEGGWSQREDGYALVNLKKMRKALDYLTIDAEPGERVRVPLNFRRDDDSDLYLPNYHSRNYLRVRLNKENKIVIQFPCGECRKYQVKTLDRILTRMGF